MTDSSAPNIHPTARLGHNCVIDADVRIGEHVALGHNCIVESDVEIGPRATIGHNVVIRSGARIGEGCLVLDGAVLGKQPAKASLSALTGEPRELPPLVLGRGVTIGANCVVYCGGRPGTASSSATSPPSARTYRSANSPSSDAASPSKTKQP